MYSPVLSAPSYQHVLLHDSQKKEISTEPESAPAPRVDYGEDPLVTACRNNDLDFLTASGQLRDGINHLYENEKKDFRVDEPISLLHVACYENNPLVVKLLLEQGSDPDIKLPRSGLTPIEVACANKQGHPAIVPILAEYLFPYRLDVNATHAVNSPDYPRDFTLLQLACRAGNAQAIRTLLANDADPNRVAPDWSAPPLHLICGTKTVGSDIIRSLLEAKASVNARYQDSTALHILCRSKQCNEQTLHALLGGQTDVNAVTSNGVTPLMLASQRNAPLAHLLLMDDYVDVTMADSRGWQAIHYAAQSGHETVINTLVDKGADANAKTIKRITPLHLAVLERYEPTIFALLDRNADASSKAPLNPYSLDDTCSTTLLLFYSVICIIPLGILTCAAAADEARDNVPIHERSVVRYAHSCCPACCGLSPLELADEGLRERMVSRTVTNQPGSSCPLQQGS